MSLVSKEKADEGIVGGCEVSQQRTEWWPRPVGISILQGLLL